jgi:hypothetical protein
MARSNSTAKTAKKAKAKSQAKAKTTSKDGVTTASATAMAPEAATTRAGRVSKPSMKKAAETAGVKGKKNDDSPEDNDARDKAIADKREARTKRAAAVVTPPPPPQAPAIAAAPAELAKLAERIAEQESEAH